MDRDTTRFDNYLVSMFGYIDNNKEKIHKVVKDVLSPVLGRPADDLENLLLFQYIDECIKKIKAFLEAGVNSIHFWPVNNYIEQIEIFSKEIICSFQSIRFFELICIFVTVCCNNLQKHRTKSYLYYIKSNYLLSENFLGQKARNN